MRFGPVPLAEAVGAILAHSVALPDGRLRKGKVLTPDDLGPLEAAGIEAVTVARLDSDDVHEDAAATRLAQALVPDPATAGLRLTQAATGRVNLIAEHAGVVGLSPAQIDAVNQVHPMITVATVPEWQRIDAGGMVATVKIIAYGVPEGALDAACVAAQAAIRLQRPVMKTAILVETVTGDDPGDKGAKVIAARLQRLGVDLTEVTQVAHDEGAIAAALSEAEADLLLILTASATSDPMDTAPQAVRAAGGAVDHYGMPVDPGNLLFLGAIGDRPVIGLPGCARSPALNGADWIMERVICGVPVTAGDIMGMGVGGLLKEIPTRPRPRAG
ncbi:MAG: molybdopterin-binding protein [Paracoccaceae bacterium]|nr:molybdopterin-binding protein [Paracoccaceae bacterium]